MKYFYFLLIFSALLLSSCAWLEEQATEIHVTKDLYLVHTEGDFKGEFSLNKKLNDQMDDVLVDADVTKVSFDKTKMYVISRHQNGEAYYKVDLVNKVINKDAVTILSRQQYLAQLKACTTCKLLEFDRKAISER